MDHLKFQSVLDAFNAIGATLEDRRPYQAIRGVSVSGDGQRFRFWEHELFPTQDESILEIRRRANPEGEWRNTPHGQTFYAHLVRAMHTETPVFIAVNRRGKDDAEGNWTAAAAAPILDEGGRPAKGRVLFADPATGEVRVTISLKSGLVKSSVNKFVDQFDVAVRKFDRRSQIFSRSQNIRRRVLRRANGKCEHPACRKPGFNTADGIYLETHHVVPLSENGRDAVKNVVALCPNCHAMAHYSTEHNVIRRELLSYVLGLPEHKL